MLHSLLKRPSALILASLLFSSPSVNSVIFFSTGDPTYNTTAPGGTLSNSGWQYQGLWGGFLGTPIAPKYFITAAHVGGSIGDPFLYQGTNYLTSAVFDDPNTDLRIWRVCGTFPRFAPLYTGTSEVGQNLVVFGRGTQRGAEVTTTNFFQTRTNGWLWGPYDGVQRWGENVVTQIVDGGGTLGQSGVGDLLAASFDSDGGPNECDLSVGDSAGAVFIQDGGVWKLAGINFAVDGPYNTSDADPGFNAAIFDQGGLYQWSGTNWVLTPDLPLPQPGSFYSTRISSRVDWINSVLADSNPDDSLPTLQIAFSAIGPYADVAAATVDPIARTITLPQSSGARFYRLRSCRSLQITSIQAQGGNVLLTYE